MFYVKSSQNTPFIIRMALVQQLEKLYEIQKIFLCGDTLEAAVAGERVGQLIARTEKIIHQRTFLREERRRLRLASEQIDERKRALAILQRTDWVPEQLRSTEEPHVRLNISGLMFEAPHSVLKRDGGSLLAQLCDAEPPVTPDADGVFFFDRDWWLFRYIMAFLRDGTLPDDRVLLAQLYKEANFWHLSELQCAIEEDKLHLRKDIEAINKDAWWRKMPNWWQAIQEAKEKEAAEAATAAAQPQDWWKDTTYNGKTFLPAETKDVFQTTFQSTFVKKDP